MTQSLRAHLQRRPLFVWGAVTTPPVCLWENLGVFYVVSWGMNYYKKAGGTIHAEQDAISRLPDRGRKALKKAHVLSIRTTRTGKLSQAKPCHHCILAMRERALCLGYRISRVYYTDDNGKIIETTLNDLFHEERHHYSAFHRLCKDQFTQN